LPPRERPGALARPLFEHGEPPVDRLDPLLGHLVQDVRPHLQVLTHRQPPEDVVALGDVPQPVADDLLGVLVGDVPAVERDRPAEHRREPEHRLHHRRFARAVGADDGHVLAGGHVHVDAVQDLQVAVAGVEAPHREQRLVGLVPRGRRLPAAPGFGVAHKYHSAETHPFKCGRKRVRLTTLLPLPVAG